MNLSFSKSLIALGLILSACGQAETANTHLGAMDETSRKMLEELKVSRETLGAATKQSERIADALVALQGLSQDLVKVIQSTFIKKPPAATDDIDSVVGSASGKADQS